MANLNFDMVASPNYVRFVYDGDGSDNPDTARAPSAPTSSSRSSTTTSPAAGSRPSRRRSTDARTTGRSSTAGIPAGGTFSGAEEIKTAAEAAIYGGTAGVAYDTCYHQACDDLTNLNLQAFDEFSDAAADAVAKLAQRPTDLTDNEPQTLAKRAPMNMPFDGPEASR